MYTLEQATEMIPLLQGIIDDLLLGEEQIHAVDPVDRRVGYARQLRCQLELYGLDTLINEEYNAVTIPHEPDTYFIWEIDASSIDFVLAAYTNDILPIQSVVLRAA